METIKLTIDNKQVEVAKGTNLVEAAASAGIRIPTLCYMNLHDLGYENKPGACRICVVEDARTSPPPARRCARKAWWSARIPRAW